MYSLYLSLPPLPAVVYFFQAGALFFTENSKFRPILAILLRIYALFGVILQGGGVPKLTNIRLFCCYVVKKLQI